MNMMIRVMGVSFLLNDTPIISHPSAFRNSQMTVDSTYDLLSSVCCARSFQLNHIALICLSV